MKNKIWVSTLREIKNTLGRYIAIVAIITLGVGFFAGLMVTDNAMRSSMQKYLTNHQFFDYRLVSTLGFEAQDIDELSSLLTNKVASSPSASTNTTSDQLRVRAIEGAKSADMIITYDDKYVVNKILSIPSDINQIELTAGRMPQKDDECVIDSFRYSESRIGETITLSDNNDPDDLDKFNYKEFKVVGLVKSPLYIQYERGSTSLGDGTIAAFIYINESAFNTDYYTEVFVKLDSDYDLYSDEYDSLIDSTKDIFKNNLEQVALNRYDRIVADAQEELDEAKSKLEDGKKELADHEKELADGENELEQHKLDLADGEQQIADAKQEVADGRIKLNNAKTELSDGENQLADAKKKLADNKAKLEAGKAELEASKAKYEAAKDYLPNAAQQKAILDATEQQLAQSEALIAEGEAQIAETEKKLATARNEIATNERKLADAAAKILENEASLEEGRQKIADAQADIEDAKKQIADAQKEIDDAEVEIADAQNEIDDIGKPDTYVLGRDTNVGYVCFESDSTIVGAIAKVFPVFFFMVAALVCMTTMGRMVEDERTQIGVMKALGYSTPAIMSKFLFYSGSAAFLGTVLGFTLGTVGFPKAIWFAYNMMYNTSDIEYYFSLPMLIISFVVALLCSVGVTLATCRVELSEMAASLMRPKAPKAGKRILLEYIPIFWNRLKFLQKVSLRNIFRYKGRLVMMLLGIGGCTALMCTGFGIYDSIADIAESQYSKISLYDIAITLTDPTEGEVSVLSELSYSSDDYILYHETTVDMVTKSGTKNIYLDVYDEDADITKFMNYHTNSGEPLSLPGLNEAILSHGVAKQYNVKVGDTVTLSSDDMNFEVKVTGIFENFIYNYIVITTPTYDTNVRNLDMRKSVLLNITKNADPYKASAAISSSDNVASVTATHDMLERVSNMMQSLNIIVYIVLACAAALAGVVVYNLTNINISERVREIATIKVLGFYKKETSAYVFRENLLLSIMGGLIGLLLGKLLHAYVISKIVVDMITFDIRIVPLSYFLSFIFTVIFTIIINLFMGRKLEAISMTESLKAVE